MATRGAVCVVGFNLLATCVARNANKRGPELPQQQLPRCGGLDDPDDWLVAGCSATSTVSVSNAADGSTVWVLDNGIVARKVVANSSSGLLATTSIEVLAGAGAGQKLSLTPAPDALMVINDVEVVSKFQLSYYFERECIL